MLHPSIKTVFWNSDEGRLRALWRLVVHGALLALVALGPVVLVGESLNAARKRGILFAGVHDELFDKVVNLIVGPLFTVMVVVSVWLAGRLLDRRRFTGFGVHLGRDWWIDLGFGLALGAVLMGLIFAVEWAAGWVVITGTLQTTSPNLPLSLALIFSLVKAMCVGTYEEFVSRGYQLTNIAEGLNGFGRVGRRGAVLLSVLMTSLIFGALHGATPNATPTSLLALSLNGILLAAGYVVTGELAIPIGLHMGWNLFEGTVFGFPVSGDKEPASVLAIRQGGPTSITGGAYGPEAGMLGAAAMVAGVLLICVWARLRHGRLSIAGRLAVPLFARDPR